MNITVISNLNTRDKKGFSIFQQKKLHQTGDQQLCTLSSNSWCIPDCPKAFQGQGYRNEDGAAEDDVVDGVEEVAESVDVNRGRAEVPTVSFHHAAVGLSKLFLPCH